MMRGSGKPAKSSMGRYCDLRPELITGHCVLWRDNSLISRVIRHWTEFSHASLVVRLDAYQGLKGRVFLVEALATGLQLRLLSERVGNYDGQVHFLMPDVLDAEQDVIRQFAISECARGVPYDYRGLLRNMLGRVSANANRYFCSEFVWDAWAEAGVVEPRPDGKAPRPGDLPEWFPVRLECVKGEPDG